MTIFDDTLAQLADDMVETMYHHNGIGLAAPQIGIPKRMFIAVEAHKDEDADESEDAPPPQTIAEKRERWGVIKEHVMINPELSQIEGRQLGVDGCLSLPGIFVEDMERDNGLRVRFQDVLGNWHELDTEGHFAWVIQHEYDHLEGVIFFDHLPETRRKAFIAEYRGEIAQMQRDAKAFLKEHKDAPVLIR